MKWNEAELYTTWINLTNNIVEKEQTTQNNTYKNIHIYSTYIPYMEYLLFHLCQLQKQAKLNCLEIHILLVKLYIKNKKNDSHKNLNSGYL